MFIATMEEEIVDVNVRLNQADRNSSKHHQAYAWL